MVYSIERHESYRGRVTPEVEWRVWNENHDSYMAFALKRDALAYAQMKLKQETA